MKFYFTLVAVVIHFWSHSQTMIAIVYDNEKIVVGADSRVSVLADGSNFNICKIQLQDSIIFTGAGIRMLEIMNIAKSFYNKTLTFEEYFENVKDTIGKYWKCIIPVLRFSDTKTYNDIIGKQSFGSLAICRIENSKPKVYCLYFSAKSKGLFSVDIKSEALLSESPPFGMATRILLGRYQCVKIRKLTIYSDYAAEVNRMITQASGCYPMSVGLPVSIAMISKEKFGFIQNGLCE